MRWRGIRASSIPNIDAITMTYGYMRIYEDRVRRAVNTPDLKGQFALWQGGMEPNIPVGSEAGVDRRHEARDRRRRARAARRRQRQVGRPLEDGPHRPAGLGEGRRRQSARAVVSAAHLHATTDADGLTLLEPAPRTDSRRARSDERRRSSTATPSARACRRRRSSPPTSSATTTCST